MNDTPEMTPLFVSSLQCRCVYPCGSRVTCDPPPEDTDEDWLALYRDYETMADAVVRLVADGFVQETHNYSGVQFFSMRKGDLNLLLTDDEDFYKRHRRATALCTRLNLSNKDDRVALFQTILYDVEIQN
jgi:hypothetical protein